ncbi:hypothetical protein CIB48_g2946 [Xylaria polymorpha]|nr:hypothetical protein CIB48_g2946 [Xylaria polymorpha]
MQYADLFNLNVALVAQDKTTGEYELFQSKSDENFPPARTEFTPSTHYVGKEVKGETTKGDTQVGDLELELQRMEMRILRSKTYSGDLDSPPLRLKNCLGRVLDQALRPASNSIQVNSVIPRLAPNFACARGYCNDYCYEVLYYTLWYDNITPVSKVVYAKSVSLLRPLLEKTPKDPALGDPRD